MKDKLFKAEHGHTSELLIGPLAAEADRWAAWILALKVAYEQQKAHLKTKESQ